MEQTGLRLDRAGPILNNLNRGRFLDAAKATTVIIDFTVVYNTFWRYGVIDKLLRETPCLKIARLIEHILSERTFQVILGKRKQNEKLNNVLPQRRILAPLFLAYTSPTY